MVMGGDSCFKGRKLESRHCILNGHFSHLFVVKIVVCVCKRGRAWPFCENNNEIVLITLDKGINKSPSVLTKTGIISSSCFS